MPETLKGAKNGRKINSSAIRTGETDIKVHLIDDFPNHPYHVFDDEDMAELTESIRANGLLNPVIVRSKADGLYEMVDSNCQRSRILPSEKAFSYKMKLEAIKRQGKRKPSDIYGTF